MANMKAEAVYGHCYAVSVAEGSDDYDPNAVQCDLKRNHLGFHIDRKRGIRWMHEAPMP